MSSAEELLARLRAHPDDQEAWLVYADWLAEQGDGRGELIALEHRAAPRRPPSVAVANHSEGIREPVMLHGGLVRVQLAGRERAANDQQIRKYG
jgi:uncharacterized protein (TIGR02996 family)